MIKGKAKPKKYAMQIFVSTTKAKDSDIATLKKQEKRAFMRAVDQWFGNMGDEASFTLEDADHDQLRYFRKQIVDHGGKVSSVKDLPKLVKKAWDVLVKMKEGGLWEEAKGSFASEDAFYDMAAEKFFGKAKVAKKAKAKTAKTTKKTESGFYSVLQIDTRSRNPDYFITLYPSKEKAILAAFKMATRVYSDVTIQDIEDAFDGNVPYTQDGEDQFYVTFARSI